MVGDDAGAAEKLQDLHEGEAFDRVSTNSQFHSVDETFQQAQANP